jgi:putative PIN family toxin of toxin-antitoxin system
MIVLDTNIALDLLLFADPASQPLRQLLASRQKQWVATMPMRDELARVLDYPLLAARLLKQQQTASQLLALWDAQVQLQPVATKAPYTCKDADDQKFIDLAVAHRAPLLSKDRAVLSMAKRLLTLGVVVASGWGATA